MKDLADRIEDMLREGEYEPCKMCTMDQVCGKKQVWCINAIKAKLRGFDTWDPMYKEEH